MQLFGSIGLSANAWTGRLHTEYRYLLQRANDDDVVRAIVVTGRGKGFCVGGDGKHSVAMRIGVLTIRGSVQTSPNPYGTDANFDASFAYHFGLNKPVIAA